MTRGDRLSKLLPVTSSGSVVWILGFVLLNAVLPKASIGLVGKGVLTWLPVQSPTSTKVAQESLAGVLYSAGYVGDALSTVERERESIEAEREAFETFADSVETMTARTGPTTKTAPPLLTDSGGPERLSRVREEYRKTVMAVPDYTDQYEETMRENMTAEFGEEVSTAVVGGTKFTPRLKRLLVSQARSSARQRGALLDVLDNEQESLAQAAARLKDVEERIEETEDVDLHGRPFPDLVECERDLRSTARDCRQLLEDRQADIHRIRRQFSGSDHLFFQEYLYRESDATFPVLNEGLDRLRSFRDTQRSVIRAITGRD